MRARHILLVAAALFVAAFLPFALSGAYDPTPFGVMSRTLGLGALVFAILAAWAIDWLMARRDEIAAPIFAILVAVLIVRSVQTAREWRWAWNAQRDLLTSITSEAKKLPPGSVVLLTWPAPFSAHYDFDSALRMATGRRDLQGDVLVGGWGDDGDEFVHYDGSVELRRYKKDRVKILAFGVFR